MENSHLFASVVETHSAGEFYELVSGEKVDQHGAPSRVAWQLERLAALRGWPAGESLGSEAWLRARLKVSRETLREAIRVVEGRGAMRMQRGRSGGLVLLCPPIERSATALAAHLHATGISAEEFAQCVRGLDQLLSWELARKTTAFPDRLPRESLRHWLARSSGRQTYLIYASALDRLASTQGCLQAVPASLDRAVASRDATEIFDALAGLPYISAEEHVELLETRTHAQAGDIALRMIGRASGRDTSTLGNEASLCEDFDASRSLVRQALRILQDLDMVQVRLGRGGGYTLKQPTPIGIIRQLFAWYAARNYDPFALNNLMWDLNSANLRLAGERLAAMSTDKRHSFCDRIDGLLAESSGQASFICLQQSLAEVAGCPLIDTLARCIVSYQARTYGDISEEADRPDLEAMKSAIIAALRVGKIDHAERTLRQLQDRNEESTLESIGLYAAAE